MSMYYMYVLESKAGKLYFGATNDLRRRLKEHLRGQTKTTRSNEWALVYYEAYRSEEDARRREDQMKLHGQAKRQVRDRIRASRQGRS